MPNTREKLIELRDAAFEHATNICMDSDCKDCPGRKYGARCKDYLEADHLIANGVTVQECSRDCKNCWKTKLVNPVQKWIPVTERLPEVVDSYLVVVKCKYDWEKEYEIGVDVATYDPHSGSPYIDGCWNTYNDWNEGQQYLHVTHWMPLPEPPKTT